MTILPRCRIVEVAFAEGQLLRDSFHDHRVRLGDRRCARCGQMDLRPAYAPPSSMCFRCHARVFIAPGGRRDG